MNPHTYNDGASQVSYWLIAGYFVDGALVPLIVGLSAATCFHSPVVLILSRQAIYPMFIIVVVALKKSQMEESFAFTSHFTANTGGMSHLTRSPVSATVETRSSQHASMVSRRGRPTSGPVILLQPHGGESLHSESEDGHTLRGLHGSKETV